MRSDEKLFLPGTSDAQEPAQLHVLIASMEQIASAATNYMNRLREPRAAQTP